MIVLDLGLAVPHTVRRPAELAAAMASRSEHRPLPGSSLVAVTLNVAASAAAVPDSDAPISRSITSPADHDARDRISLARDGTMAVQICRSAGGVSPGGW
jgi:hypothetical protein